MLKTVNWQEFLLKDCLTQNWQMNDSEKIALAGLLARINPNLVLEIGTYYGGSLSLIRQYAEEVYSIDIDPEVPKREGDFPNVKYLIGDSKKIIPDLLNKLDRQGKSIDFILIDGDHSYAGVKRDINLILQYQPKKPLFIMFHDSFNPECRAGILDAAWEHSDYLKWMDIDFVPGRRIEGDNNPFAGSLWGGLALAYLTPSIQDKGLTTITQSSNNTFKRELISFTKSQDIACFPIFISGWYNQEEWGRWSAGEESIIRLHVLRALENSDNFSIEININGKYFGNSISSSMFLNDEYLGKIKFNVSGECSFLINSRLLKKNVGNFLSIKHEKVTSPFQKGISNDRRSIKLGLYSMTISLSV